MTNRCDLFAVVAIVRRFPERFVGKKVVCPKCSSVLRIERLAKKTADLLVRCPWCDDVSDLNLEKPACGFCKRELEFDVFVGPLGAQPAAKPAQSKPNPPAAIPVAVPQDKKRLRVLSCLKSSGILHRLWIRSPAKFMVPSFSWR